MSQTIYFIIYTKLTLGFGVLIVPASQRLNTDSAHCTEALCTRECMVAHQLAVPRTAVAEVNIYV